MSVAPPSTAASLVESLKGAVGPENVIHHRDELVVYECDGYVIEKKRARRGRLPDVDRARRRDRQALQRARRPVRPARGGHQPGRRHARRSAAG